jgi:antitoxin CptB
MGGFARQHVPSFNEKQLQEYEELLQENDPNLYNWITGKDETPAHISSDLLNKIKAQYE